MFEIEVNLRSDRLPERPFRQSGMGRMIVDSWRGEVALANTLLAIEHDYVNLR